MVFSLTVVDEAAIETAVVEWVHELLEDPGVLPSENFLVAGGHSMLAVELNQRAVERFGVELDLQLLFEETLEDVSTDLARQLATRVEGAVP